MKKKLVSFECRKVVYSQRHLVSCTLCSTVTPRVPFAKSFRLSRSTFPQYSQIRLPKMGLDPRLEKLVLDLFEINALKFGDFKMKVGVNSPVYFDLRAIVSYPALLDTLTTLISEMILKGSSGKPPHICGVPYTALPIATLVSYKTKIPMLIRRREAKNYGTKKMIEGHYKKGDECVIIEDVVTSGSSIIDTLNDLKKEGLQVSTALVVVDRGQGGTQNLKEEGIEMNVLITLSQILDILFAAKKITQKTVENVRNYITETQINIDGSFRVNKGLNDTGKKRLRMSFGERAKLAENLTAKKLFNLMEEKKSLLCVAADVRTTSELFQLAKKVGPHICILKTHFDIMEDFTMDSKEKLVQLASTYNFIIMEDRKLSDIGNTVSLQYSMINSWAELVTAHSLIGQSVVEGIKLGRQKNPNSGCFLVAELSSQGSLINKKYAQETATMAEKHSDVVVGLVCQSPDVITLPQLIQLTPGVRLDQKEDNLGQTYNDPEYAVLEKGADVAVVGRGIISASDPEKMASIYKEKLWAAYQVRIKSC